MHLAAIPRAKPGCCRCSALEVVDEVERYVLTIIERIIIIIIIIINVYAM